MVLAGLIAVILVFSLIRLSDTKPTVADGSALILKLEGEVPEKPPVEIPLGFFEQQRRQRCAISGPRCTVRRPIRASRPS